MSNKKDTAAANGKNNLLVMMIELKEKCRHHDCSFIRGHAKEEAGNRVKMTGIQGTAFFVKQPSRMEELRVPHRFERRKPFAVVKTIKLSKMDYENFVTDLCADRPFIEEHKKLCGIGPDGVWRCLLVQRRGKSDGVLVMPDGKNYPKYAAFYCGREQANRNCL